MTFIKVAAKEDYFFFLVFYLMLTFAELSFCLLKSLLHTSFFCQKLIFVGDIDPNYVHSKYFKSLLNKHAVAEKVFARNPASHQK